MQNRKLGRKADHRKALLRNMATSVMIYGKIETTEKKAMELRTVVDELITLGKANTLHSRRQAAKVLFNVKDPKSGKTALQILFEDVAPKYQDRSGGYTRVHKTEQRRGDAAPMAIFELV